MEILALVPGVIALVWCVKKGPQRAFLDVYVPVLLCLPAYYIWKAPGLPDPNFNQAAILPIAAFFFLRNEKTWRFSVTDALVTTFALGCAWSEYQAAGYKEAQNLFAEMLLSVMLPYVLAKGIIEPHGLRVAFAKRYALLLFAVALFSVWEFRMGYSPFQRFVGPFFPWQGTGWVTTFRWGFARIAGPFAHAILAGLVFATGFRIARWLQWSGHWERKFAFWPNHPLTKGQIISLGILGGVLMSLCRGPWLGALLGAFVAAIGKSKQRWTAVVVVVVALVVVGLPSAVALYEWASVQRSDAKSDAQETAAYRKELLDEYVTIALDHAVFGWGRNTWPKVAGMPSIDNHYLLIALMHGLVALFSLWAIMGLTSVRLFLHSMKRPPPRPYGSDFGFTLLSVYAVYALTILTVYMGEQTVPIFFIFTGWADGYLLRRRAEAPRTLGAAQAATARPAHAWRRVLT
jgi:hypothetical protein